MGPLPCRRNLRRRLLGRVGLDSGRDASRNLGRAARRRLERLVVFRDRLILSGVGGALFAMEILLLRVIGLAFLVQCHLRLQIRQHLCHGKL
jgi:hypothetical protein